MQLRNARLCLDCEEVHDAPHCPACASETFAFISRWIPAPERRARPRAPEPPSLETLDTYKHMLDPDGASPRWSMAKRGAVGLALFGVAGWMWRRNTTRTDDREDRDDRDVREDREQRDAPTLDD
jgi:hypothetical protein